ncbi:GNAT family N-acetyltransferase [Formosa sp. Hel1_31_208]|uniref:GNAT family N-acetyltransferase n=1 Tax=Formosa sp. Hel1_31_208 TaxID=1798225 RepID=UPI0012FE18C8|nr:GNAT family protein [Formosa sp. Hel1_31_208]
MKNIDWNVPKAELGSFIESKYEDYGLTTQATSLVVDHIISTYNFIKLLCCANSRNKGSIAVILKNGFQLKGTIRKDYRTTQEEIVDLNYYGRVF